MTDQPTTHLPLPGRAQWPPAWADAETRRSVNRALWVAILMLVVAVVAAGACVVLVQLGYLSAAWGLGALVVAGGLAGGALAGGVTILILWSRTRSLLRDGAWVPGRLTLGDDREAELVFGRTLADVELETRTASLGDPDDTLSVEVRSDGHHILITVPPSRRILRARSTDED